MVKLLLVCLAAAGCADQAVVVEPVVDVPVDDPEASAFANIDEVIITVAHEGSDRDLVSAAFTRGEAAAISGAPFGEDLVIHMSGFIGSSLDSYGRTCAFVVAADCTPPSPHLFFSRQGKFASLGVTPFERVGGGAISYLGGALVLGGAVRGDAVSNIERFDPATGALTTVGELDPRDGAVEALIGSSPPRVAVLGGEIAGVGAPFLELVDPGRAVDRYDDPMGTMARVGLTATSLTDGRVVVVGGNPPGAPPTGELVIIEIDGTGPTVKPLVPVLAHPRSGHTATRLGDDLGAPVLIAGGVDELGAPVAIAELFKPLSGDLANPVTFAPAMLVPRSHHQAVRMRDGSILIIGGIDAAGDPVHIVERFTVDGGFVSAGELPDSAGVIDGTATALPDGRVLITGGRPSLGAAPVNTAFLAVLDDKGGSVAVIPSSDHLMVPRANHQAAPMCDGTVLITGGTDGPVVAERYNPSYEGRR